MTVTINNTVFTDNAFGTLASGLTVSDTTLAFTSGHGARFPAVTGSQVLYCCLLNSSNAIEEIKITAHAAGSDSATISRAAGGTTAKTWAAGDRIEARFSSSSLYDALGNVLVSTGSQTLTGDLTITGTATAATAVVTGPLTVSGTATVASFGGAAVAAQSDQETATATDKAVSPGRQHFHPSASKAWGLATAPTTITTSYPSAGTSVTNPGTGVYTVTHGVTFSSVNYAVQVTPISSTVIAMISVSARDATTFTVSFFDGNGNPTAVTGFSYDCKGDL